MTAAPAAQAGLADPTPGAITAQTLHLPGAPGSVQGLADPATVKIFTGQVDYNIPINLPAGRGGFGPSLAINYSGERGNGPLGVGWSLGQIAIRRTLRQGVPTYTDADQLELVGLGGGGRLYTTDGKRYWVEGAGHSIKIDHFGDWFDVTDSNGLRYIMGLDPNSVEGDGKRTFAWLVESIVDVTGQQRIDFTYTHDAGEVYLQSITWGPPVSTGGPPAFSLQVELEKRPDKVISWATGYEVRTEQRVKSLQVISFGETLRRYAFGYLPPNPSFRLSRLTTVNATGHESAGKTPEALPTVTLKYQPPSGDGAFQVPDLNGWELNQRGTTLVDVDGDGMADLYRMEQGAHWYRKGTGKGFSTTAYPVKGAEGIDLEGARLMDLDGDARPDLVRIVNDTWRWSRLVPEGVGSLAFRWVSQGEWPGTTGVPLKSSDTEFADINGDGRVDVIQGAAGAVLIRLATSTGLGPVRRLPPISMVDASVEPGHPDVRFEDFNGDDLVDVAWFTDNSIKVWLGRGDGTFAPWNRFDLPWKGTFRDDDLKLADLDRDGLIDLIRTTADNVMWFPGLPGVGFSPDGRWQPRPVGVAIDAVVAIGDANGNGSQDVVWSNAQGMWVLDLAGHSSAGLVQQIDNGMGMTTDFTFSSSAVLAVAAEQQGNPWLYKLPVSVPVPVGMTSSLASGDPPRPVEYVVRDGVWDGAERRFAGFLASQKIIRGATAAETLREETLFLPGLGSDRVLRGTAWLTRTKSDAGTIFSETVSDWAARRVSSMPALPDSAWARMAVKKSEVTRSFEGVDVPIETLSTFDFDDEGRTTVEHHLGRKDLTGDEKEIRRTFGDDGVTWVRNRVCEETVLAADQAMTVVSQTRTLYGDDSATILPLCKIGRGWIRQVQGLRKAGFEPGETDLWVELRANTYDSFGNAKHIVEHGVGRDITYDARGLHPVTETVTPGGTKQPLTWTLTWNDAEDVPKSLTDPNNITTLATYDSLQREISREISPSRCPHTYTQYDWSKPAGATFFRPTITTFAYDGDHSTLAFSGDRQTACAPKDPRNQTFDKTKQWHQTVSALTGAGEAAFTATRLDLAAWTIGSWTERDGRGQVGVLADPFYLNQTALPTTRPAVPDFHFRTLHYDVLQRLDRQTLATGGEKTISYKAYETTVSHNTIGTGEVKLADTVTTTDGFGRIIRTKRQLVTGVEVSDATYDSADRLLQVSLQNGQVVHTLQYDTLGLLRVANDPDVGQRRWRYDGEFLIRAKNGADQVIAYFYDGVGRLFASGPRDLMSFASPVVAYDGGQGQDYVYNYDSPEPGKADLGNLKSRLASVTEPPGAVAGTSRVAFGYDLFGRPTMTVRQVGGVPGEERDTLSPSGLLLKQEFDDGLVLTPEYDAAGRLARLGDVWHAGPGAMADTTAGIDAAGRVLSESFGNGVTTTVDRDAIGLPTKIQVNRALTALFGVSIPQRTSFGAPVRVDDLVPSGRDQSAVYIYDDAARLADASLGSSVATRWHFRFRYDGLQNLSSRFQEAPPNTPASAINVVSGYYRYGGPGFGPRQLSSIIHKDCPNDLSTFDYDKAGRIKRQDTQVMTYDAYDRLVKVEKPAGTTLVSHGYGYEGLRTSSTGGGLTQRWFSPLYTLHGSERWHYVTAGDRLVAKLVFPNSVTTLVPGGMTAAADVLMNRAFAAIAPHVPAALGFAAVVTTLALVVLMILRGRRPGRPAVAVATAWALLLAPLGCSQTEPVRQGVETVGSRIYFHQGLDPGPTLITRQDGSVEDERRFEPFGEPLDGDLKTKDPYNSLNKERDPQTGWSFHGARWMAPQVARWLTPDPSVQSFDAEAMKRPWDLNPYQYARQNPKVYWDPNGADAEVEEDVEVEDPPESGAEHLPAGARTSPAATIPKLHHNLMGSWFKPLSDEEVEALYMDIQAWLPQEPEAVAYREEYRKKTHNPIHHIATNKNSISTARGGPWTPRFEAIFEKTRVGTLIPAFTLNDDINLIALEHHRGPHPREYHQYVYDTLIRFTKDQKPYTLAYRSAVVSAMNELKEELLIVGSPLNRLVTKGAWPDWDEFLPIDED
jgi:RHS repeat-associated protein